MSQKLTKLTGQPEFYEMSVKIENIVTGEKKSTTKRRFLFCFRVS